MASAPAVALCDTRDGVGGESAQSHHREKENWEKRLDVKREGKMVFSSLFFLFFFVVVFFFSSSRSLMRADDEEAFFFFPLSTLFFFPFQRGDRALHFFFLRTRRFFSLLSLSDPRLWKKSFFFSLSFAS